MKNVLYEKIIGPLPKELRDQVPRLELTEEVNGFAIFHINERGDVALVEWISGDKNDAIERAVELAIERARPGKIGAAS